MLYSESYNCDKSQTQVDNQLKLRVIMEGTQTHVHAKFGSCTMNRKKDRPFLLF